MNKSEYVIARVDPELKQRLVAWMKYTGKNESQVVRDLIEMLPVTGKVENSRVVMVQGLHEPAVVDPAWANGRVK